MTNESVVEEFVAEYQPTGFEPDGTNLEVQASYWTTVNSKRWSQAEDLEARTGIALCDSDPLKLHYSWCLAAVGAAPRERFEYFTRRSPSRSPTGTRRWTGWIQVAFCGASRHCSIFRAVPHLDRIAAIWAFFAP